MAVWVDCSTTPSYFGGFAADVGEYTGPWPMLPPPAVLLSGGAEGDELDYVLGFPNPAHPDDPGQALDDSYTSPIWNNWRFLSSAYPNGSYIGYRRTYSGTDPAAAPSATDVPPPGVHLYVISYFGEPANPPESYVPIVYASGGTCPVASVNPGVSSWQSGIPVAATVESLSYDAFAVGTPHSQSRFGPDDPDGSWGSVHEAVQQMLDGVHATSWDFNHFVTIPGVTYTSDPDGQEIARYMGAAQTFFGPHWREALVKVTPLALQYDAVINQPYPLSGKVAGVDYSPIPWADDDTFQYQAPGAAEFAWGDLTATTQTGFFNLDGTAADHTPYPATMRFTRLDEYPTGTITGPILGGEPLLDVPMSETDLAWTDHPVPMSGVTGHRFILSVAMTFWTDGEISTDLAPDLPDPLVALQQGRYQFSYLVKLAPLNYNWVTSQWRYGLPEGPALAWHNLTGHWRTFTDATLSIFTPGLDAVPMVDGLP